MATFECKIYELKIEEHPNADALELAVVGDYRSIVQKGQFKTGDLGVYIPEAAVLPDWLISSLGLEGKLAGKQQNRVKAIKLRGILSQGLVYPVHEDSIGVIQITTGPDPWCFAHIHKDEDVTNLLGITKYEPPIPVHMAGEVFNAFGCTLKYDIENVKKYPTVLKDGEEVVMTEKIHGSWCCFGYHPKQPSYIITSKGLSEKGLAFKINEANKNNLYLRALNKTAPYPDGTGGNVLDRANAIIGIQIPFYILGEVFGAGVQDLTYGNSVDTTFRVFDVYVGDPGHGRYLDDEELENFCSEVNVDRVPVLYRGPFSKEIMEQYTSGKETVSGSEANIREGIVITPAVERYDTELGRVKLKSVSDAYLLRGGNVTEYT